MALQDAFLNHLRREGASVSIFLMKGLRLQGQISGFDAYALTLRRKGEEQLVYKQAIASILAATQWRPEEADLAGGDRQQEFLRRRRSSEVRLYLINGVSLAGTLLGHDSFCLLLSANEGEQIVFKHAVATVNDGDLRA